MYPSPEWSFQKTEKQMSTAELRNRLIEKIQNTQDGRILEEAYRLLDLEIEDIDVFELNDAQKRAISEAREQINNGQFFTEEAANKEIDEWLNE